MKKTLLTLAMGMVGVVMTQAQPVEITLTGATAFRANAYTAVRGLFDAGFLQNPTAGDPSLSNRVTWTGTMSTVFGARAVTVRAGYSGSTAGIGSLTANANVTFLALSTAGDFTTVSRTADFAFSDVFQTSSATLTPALEDTTVGVIPFVWVRGSSCDLDVVNITAQNARAIFNLGYLPLYIMTGNPADAALADIVNVAGRNPGSGTRAAVLAEIGSGPLASIVQRKTNGVAGAGARWIDDAAGFSSNSQIPTHINSGVAQGTDLFGNTRPGGCIGYLDLNDAATVTGAGGAILQYDGVTFTKDAVRYGKYALWTYEHLLNRFGLPVDEVAFRTAIVNQIDADLATSVSAIQTSTMFVVRPGDGATITD